MPEASDLADILRQNLVDAGCGEEMVRQCMAFAGERDCAGLLRVLACHRRMLLDTVHRNERRIDCLDYLVYRLERQQR